MIVDLVKSGMSLAELSSEYGIAKSTINGWIKDVKEIKVDENEVMTLKVYMEPLGFIIYLVKDALIFLCPRY